jgi:lysophospholipase L1-like esterase
MANRINLKIIAAALLLLCCNFTFAQSRRQNLNIVFIGNSITYGAGLADPSKEAPPVIAADYLKKQANIGSVDFSNQGHSGYTTLDFLPATNAFKAVEQAAKAFTDKQALLMFSLKLGTNDSAESGTHGAPVSPEDYRNNLKTIVDTLLKEFPGCIVVFEHPVWYSPNTYNGARYLAAGLARLQSYVPQIDQLVKAYNTTNPKQVFTGDTKAFNYFKQNYLTDCQAEQGHEGTFYLHPNKQGAVALGTFWGVAINKVVKRLEK